MFDFHKFLCRHGEGTVQYLIEQMEQNEGIRHSQPLDLEQRWEALMTPHEVALMQSAA
jgi:hypothetical protein